MAQTIYAPIVTGNLSEIAAAPFKQNEARVMTRIANADKAVQESGIYDVSTAGLAPNMQEVAKPWIESIKKNMSEGIYSNDQQKVNEARRQAQELKAFVDSGKLATTAANQSMLFGEKNMWRGLSVDENTGKQLYSDFTQKPFNLQFDGNGYPLIATDEGGLQSPLAAKNLSPQNYLVFTEAIDWGKNIDPKAYVSNYEDLVTTATSPRQVAEIVTKQFNEDIKLGRIKPDDIGVSYLLNKDYRGIRPEQIGESRIIEEKDIVIGDEELFGNATQNYLGNAIEAATEQWNAATRFAARKAGDKEPKAPKFEQRTTTIQLSTGEAVPNTTQYTLTSPLKVGAKTFYNVYKTPDGRWYGFSATTKRRGSQSFVEEELVELDARQSDYVVGTLGLKGATATNRATRAASRM
jgi:hypothetical protein